MDPSKLSSTPESKLHFLDYWRIIRIRKTVILAVFLLVVITATLVTFILPESFASTARIKVERDRSDIQGFMEPQAISNYDPYFIQTEFEVIQSEKVLGKVVDEMNLIVEWGKKYAGGERLKRDEAITLLKGRMDLRPVRNTSLIEIRVFSEKPEEAARIANAIAYAYKDYRKEQKTKMTMGGIDTLAAHYQEHEKNLEDARKKVEELRAQFKISDIEAQDTRPAPTIENAAVGHLESLRLEGEAQYVKEQKLFAGLKSKSRQELRKVILTALNPDQLLGTYMSDLNLAEQRLIALAKDYQEDHPLVKNARQQADDLNRKIDERVDAILVGLEERLASMKAGVDALKEKVASARDVDVQRSKETRPYYEAKEKLESLKRFGQILQLKMLSEKTDLALPKSMSVDVLDEGKPGLKPVRPNKPLNIALGVIIGLVVGVGLAFFIEYLDTSVKTIDDVERSLQAAVLGVIPQNVGVLLEEGAESPHAEAYRVLRTNLLFSRKDDKLNTICIVSAGAGEGKSTTVMNLATVFAQSGQRVLIVDSDLRRPTLHKMLGVTNNLGLTNYLLRQNTLEEVVQTTKVPELDFLASGKLPSSSLGILSSAQMKDLITELKQRYDFVLFDSPPIMGVSDASILASEVDMSLQVIQYRRYPQPMNIRAKQMIEKVGGNLVGIVLNNINMSQDESYYYYSGYYHDYYSKNDDDSAPAAKGEGAAADKAKIEIKQKY
jgi:capsular exopolysaccharide synthesis family protein